MHDHPPLPPNPAPTPTEEIDPDLLAFTPAPSRKRTAGWTPERQRAFVAHLRRTGRIALAARSVGLSPQSAWALRKRPGAQEFATAWDIALDAARDDALEIALHHVTNGSVSVRRRHGRFVALVHRYDTRVALAALRALDRVPPDARES